MWTGKASAQQTKSTGRRPEASTISILLSFHSLLLHVGAAVHMIFMQLKVAGHFEGESPILPLSLCDGALNGLSEFAMKTNVGNRRSHVRSLLMICFCEFHQLNFSDATRHLANILKSGHAGIENYSSNCSHI